MPSGTSEDQPSGQFTDDVLDEKYYGRPAPGVLGRTGLLLGILIGACLAAFGAWVLLFDPLPEQNADQPIRITADPQPYKVAPDDPGGADIPNQDRLVYDRLDRRQGEGAEVETLISRPETPAAPEEPPPVPAEPSIPAQDPADPPSLAPQLAEAPVVEAEPAPQVVAPPPEPVPEPEPSSTPAEPAPAPVSVPSTVSAPPPSGWSVQLVAMRSEEAALEAWQQFSQAQPDLLGTMAPRIVEADLGERGIFYRLKTGDWADRAPADALCAALQERRVECRVTAP